MPDLSLPELLTQQALLQQRQKIGQQLLQQANTQNPIFENPASGGPYGVVPHYGIGNGLVTMGQALMGSKMSRDAARDYAQMMGSALQGMNSYGDQQQQQAPQDPSQQVPQDQQPQQQANIPADPNASATMPSDPGYQPQVSPQAMGQALQAPQGPAPQMQQGVMGPQGPMPQGQMPQGVAGAPMGPGILSNSQLATSFALDPQGTIKFLMDQHALTPEARNAMAAGFTPGTPAFMQYMQRVAEKGAYIAPINARPASVVLDPITHQPIFQNPSIPAGSAADFGPNGQPTNVHVIPGAAEAQQSAAAASAIGGAQGDVVKVTLPDGSEGYVTKTALLQSRQPQPQQAAPQQSSPQQAPDNAGPVGAGTGPHGDGVPDLPGVPATVNGTPNAANPDIYRNIPKAVKPQGIGQSTSSAAMSQEQGKDWADREQKINEDAQSAQEKIAQNNEMLKIVPTVNTGPLAEDITHLKGILHEFGLGGDNLDPSKPQEFEKLARQGAVALAKQIYGPRITNADLDNQIKSNPGMNLAQKANYEILKLDNMRQQRFLDQQSAYYTYKNKGGDLSQFDPWFNRSFPNWGGVSARANPKPGDLTPKTQPAGTEPGAPTSVITKMLGGKPYHQINGKWYAGG